MIDGGPSREEVNENRFKYVNKKIALLKRQNRIINTKIVLFKLRAFLTGQDFKVSELLRENLVDINAERKKLLKNYHNMKSASFYYQGE